MFESNSESTEVQLCRARISIAQRDLYIQQANEDKEEAKRTLKHVWDLHDQREKERDRVKEENDKLVEAIEKLKKAHVELIKERREILAELTKHVGQHSFVVVDDIETWDPVQAIEDSDGKDGRRDHEGTAPSEGSQEAAESPAAV